MDLDIQQHLPEDFSAGSKVWIYQSSRLFLISEALEMEDMLKDFAANWKSHGSPVKGFANLFFGRFIVLMADETATGVSGCSTDSSVHLIKSIEKKYISGAQGAHVVVALGPMKTFYHRAKSVGKVQKQLSLRLICS